MPPVPHAVVAGLAALALGGCGLGEAATPSLLPRPEERPRRIPVPEPGFVRLSDEERQQLAADLARDAARLAEAEGALAAEERELARALAAARRAPWGSLAWAEAQVALSRFEEARFPLSALLLSIEDSLRLVMDLAPDDPARAEVVALQARASGRLAAAEATAEAARRALER